MVPRRAIDSTRRTTSLWACGQYGDRFSFQKSMMSPTR